MRRVALLPLAAVLLAGCAGIQQNTDWPDLQANPREFFNLNPPVRLAAGEPVAGPVVLKQGQALVVTLPEDASTGYVWRMRPPAGGVVIAPVQHDYTRKPGADPAIPGAAGEATFRLRGIARGTQAVTIDYVRPGFPTPEKSIAFDVTVQ
ncbi:MAG TPA: protease inhibitor I42 family protein [Casimicrobiaceae bacterium]|nr:protease inhibitor I42 family protein [Casimicrobiaceae bacterium]